MKFANVLLMSLSAALCINATEVGTFDLKPINLGNGWMLTGALTTDGTIGPLTPANITQWSLDVVQTTDIVWTERDSNDLNISGVTSDGTGIFVSTSRDGFTDGGTLYFSRGGAGGTIPTSAVVADFTQLSVNLGYGYGGIGGWQDEILGLNYIGLNRKLNTNYRAASAIVATPNTFRIHVPRISPPPYQITLTGTLTTDGTVGLLQPRNILTWQIRGRIEETTNFTQANSRVMFVAGVRCDGTTITVDHVGGQFVIGMPGPRPTFVTLADFTDPSRPNGFANYYMGNFGVMGEKSPLVGNKAFTYTVAKAQ